MQISEKEFNNLKAIVKGLSERTLNIDQNLYEVTSQVELLTKANNHNSKNISYDNLSEHHQKCLRDLRYKIENIEINLKHLENLVDRILNLL